MVKKEGTTAHKSARECTRGGKKQRRNIGFKAEFNGIIRDVRERALPAMTKFQRKEYEESKLRALGAKVGNLQAAGSILLQIEKRRKMPFPELIARRKAQRRKVDAQLEREKELGVKIRISKHLDYYEAMKAKKRRDQRFKRPIK
eukprot:Gregarina_sp_Poly_1__7661@NODE_4308_length_653_cov_136_979522_g2856_i0_p1_GENE_NODE_4308_length_653_cov_136_979522_g2856_i0NODE_4308_length_653_cov_136_979522_g2856_i0_p1_ORF_typecomplete_len145_score32_27DUF4602/PF15375_6/0_00011_NODE_4308_length_653_cov_136_979522_g2856_i0190624